MKDRGFTKEDGTPDPLALSKASGVDVSVCRRYLYEGERNVEIGKKNAPRLARALGIDEAELVFGRERAA